MNTIEREEFAVMKNEITHIKGDVNEMKVETKESICELKTMLSEHVKWEADKYDEMGEKFAPKWVEKAIVAVGIMVTGSIIILLVQLI